MFNARKNADERGWKCVEDWKPEAKQAVVDLAIGE